MTYAPVLPLSGVGGWSLLKRVEDRQRELFARSPQIAREEARFRDRIGEVSTAGELVADRRLLRVALTAFGLEAELDKRAFIRAALESDLSDRESFANRLVDKRYRKLAQAFGFGSGAPRTRDPETVERIVSAFRTRAFERAIGESDPAMRLALNARRELAAYAGAADPDGAAWFAVLGDRPVREVLEKALGLPASFASLDIDRQHAEMRRRTRDLLGDSSLAAFRSAENVEKVIRRFLTREAAAQAPAAGAPGLTALSILRAGTAGFANLVASDLS
jgi:hypothetical protein